MSFLNYRTFRESKITLEIWLLDSLTYKYLLDMNLMINNFFEMNYFYLSEGETSDMFSTNLPPTYLPSSNYVTCIRSLAFFNWRDEARAKGLCLKLVPSFHLLQIVTI